MSDEVHEPPLPPEETAGLGCTNCFKRIGEGTPIPRRKCGKCRAVSYCSQECAVTNWKQHLSSCRYLQTTQQRREEVALRSPTFDAMRKDLNTYAIEVHGEVRELAARSGFRITQPDHLRHSHHLRLSFDWDPEPTNIRRRFTLFGTGLFSHEEVMSSEVSWRDALPTMVETREETALPEGALSMVVCFCAQHRRAAVNVSLFKPLFSYTLAMHANPIIPYLHQNFIPDWPRTLAMSLARPVQPTEDEVFVESLVASEGFAKAIRVMMRAGTSAVKARRFAKRAQSQLAAVPSFYIIPLKLDDPTIKYFYD